MFKRPLWASTGTKDPKYSDVKYIEPLIGLYTVNTLPDDTITAFADHGVIIKDSIMSEVEISYEDLANLRTYDIDTVTQRLLNDGTRRFQVDYDNLLSNLEDKKVMLITSTR